MNLEKNKGIIIGLGVFLFLLISSTLFICSVLLDNAIYKGISVDNIEISGLTKEKGIEKLNKSIVTDFNKLIIPVYFNNEEVEVTPASIGAKLNLEKAVEEAFNVGRKGSITNRFSEIFSIRSNNKNFDIEVTYDKDKFLKEISKLTKGYDEIEIMPTYAIKGAKLIIKSGVTASVVDTDTLFKNLENSLSKLNISPIDIKLVTKKPPEINVEDIYSKVHTEPVDASYKEEDKKFIIIPHKIGIDFDILEAKSVVETVYKENQEIEIPIDIKQPKMSTKMLLDTLFTDTLASFSTRYNTADTQRAENLRVATKSINGRILLPGEAFSYNETLGPRTIENGYKEAHVYSKGKVIQGLGGGICQVSTTLYNVTLLADVEILERRNHNMTVAYVKPGTDATVSYGTIDFKFKNNKDYPIKLTANVSGGKVNIAILGTDSEENKKVEIVTNVLSTKNPVQTIIEDPTMPVGTTKVIQKGQKGYLVKAYKIVKVDGVKVSEKLLSTDRYIPMENIIRKGTKAVAVTPTPVINEPTITPEPTAPLIDETIRPDGIPEGI